MGVALRRRQCLALVVALAAPWVPRVSLGKTLRPARIGYLVLAPLGDPPSPERAAFLAQLHASGYRESENLTIEYRSADGDPERLPFLAEELVTLAVDVIVVAGTLPAIAARAATRDIPVVFLFAVDPVESRLVASLSRPGGNATGTSALAAELGGKRLELLQEMRPGLRRVAVLWDPGLGVSAELRTIEAAARQLGIAIHRVALHAAADIGPAFDAVDRAQAAAVLVTTDARMPSYRHAIVELAAKRRLPTMFGLRAFVTAGGLMSYAPGFPALARRAALQVDRILRGAHPSDVPVEQPTEFELVVNLTTAKRLGLTIPRGILLRADELFTDPNG